MLDLVITMLQLLWSVLALFAAGVVSVTVGPAKRAVPAGFVTTNGNEFELDSRPFVRPKYNDCVAILMIKYRILSARTHM